MNKPLSKNKHLCRWVEKMAQLTKPHAIHWVTGSQEEYEALCAQMVEAGTFKKLNEKLKDPMLNQWYGIQQSLAGDGAQAKFDSDVKDAGLPGGDVPFFKGKVISAEPADKQTKIVVAVWDPAVADATLLFDDPLLTPVNVGDVIEFKGVADSFTKEPFMLTFKSVEGPALKTGQPPKPKPVRKKK